MGHRDSQVRHGSMHRACTGLSQTGVPAPRGDVGTCPILDPEAITTDNCLQRGISFLQWTLTGHTNATSGQDTCPATDGQHRTNSVVFLGVF